MFKPAIGAEGFVQTFDLYPVTDEEAQELYNYFIHGYPPGSFHTAVYANDLWQAAFKSHPSNQWNTIQATAKWVYANAPAGSAGSYENIKNWTKLSEEERRKICEDRGWLLTEEELTWKLVSEEIQ